MHDFAMIDEGIDMLAFCDSGSFLFVTSGSVPRWGGIFYL